MELRRCTRLATRLKTGDTVPNQVPENLATTKPKMKEILSPYFNDTDDTRKVVKRKAVQSQCNAKASKTVEITDEVIDDKRPPKSVKVMKGISNSKDDADTTTEKHLKVEDIEDTVRWEPKHWREVVDLIREMRSKILAPVDSMGCDQCADGAATPAVQRFHNLVSLMLSSQTKDQVTFAAVGRLRELPGGLTIDTILNTPDDRLGQIIIPVGFWKTKVKHLKATCEILKSKFSGDIPNTVEGLCSLPGVGPKMAHLCMSSAWGVVSGIGVDTHVHRISNRLHWVKKPTKTPEETRKQLESWLPKELWREVNHMLVGLGQTVCKPIGPNCNDCLANKLCPSAGKCSSPTKRKPKAS